MRCQRTARGGLHGRGSALLDVQHGGACSILGSIPSTLNCFARTYHDDASSLHRRLRIVLVLVSKENPTSTSTVRVSITSTVQSVQYVYLFKKYVLYVKPVRVVDQTRTCSSSIQYVALVQSVTVRVVATSTGTVREWRESPARIYGHSYTLRANSFQSYVVDQAGTRTVVVVDTYY